MTFLLTIQTWGPHPMALSILITALIATCPLGCFYGAFLSTDINEYLDRSPPTLAQAIRWALESCLPRGLVCINICWVNSTSIISEEHSKNLQDKLSVYTHHPPKVSGLGNWDLTPRGDIFHSGSQVPGDLMTFCHPVFLKGGTADGRERKRPVWIYVGSMFACSLKDHGWKQKKKKKKINQSFSWWLF